MQVIETLNEGLRRSFSLQIPGSAIEAKVSKAIADVAPRVRLPGFRPGKVPGNLIRRMHGASLRQEAIREAIDDGLKTLIGERSLRPAGQPTVEIDRLPEDGQDLVVSVSLEVLPEVPATDIEGIALERWTVDVAEADVEAALARLAEAQKRFVAAADGHEATHGDLVVMDFRGTVDGQPFEGSTGEGMEIELGSGRLLPGFEDQLLGAKAGEERVVRLAIPADYPVAAIAGKAAEFAVRVVAVRVAEIPARDDALARNLGLDSLEALKDVLKDRLERELSGLTRTFMKRKLLDHLAASCRFEVPPSMVEAEFAQIWRQLTDGASDEEKAKAEAERDDYLRIAERRVRLGLLLSDIGQKNGIQVTPSEMNRLIAGEAARYPGQETEVRRFFTENAVAAAQLRAPLFEDKVVDFLIGKAKVTERKVTRAELEAAIESEDETPIAASSGEAPGHGHGPDGDNGEPAARQRALQTAPSPQTPRSGSTAPQPGSA